MLWMEIKTEMEKKCVKLMTVIKENPVEALTLGGMAAACLAWTVHHMCETNEEAVDVFDQTGKNEIVNESLESEVQMMQSERTYIWKEFGHIVSEHERHYQNGTVVHIPSYMKITGGKV